MKTLRTIFVILATISICEFAHSQAESDIQILQATYGADSAQMDVTEKVQSLVQSGQTNVRVGNHLFGKDPVYGKVKTLSITFVQGGVQYQTTVREGEQLSFANPNVGQSNVAQPLSTPVLVTPRLAPEGTYFLTGSTSVIKDGALIGLHAGTEVRAVHDNGDTLHVKWGDSELDVDKRILTNDLNVAQTAMTNDQRAQAIVGSWMRQQETTNAKQKVEQLKALEASAHQMEKPRREPNQRAATEADRNLPPGHYITRGLSPGWNMRGVGDNDENRNIYKRLEQKRFMQSQIDALKTLRGNKYPLTPQQEQLQHQIDQMQLQLNMRGLDGN
jgi:hypothetical protein